MLWPVHHGLLRYSGFDVLQPFATHAPIDGDDDTHANILRRYDHRLRHLNTVPTLSFHPHTDTGQDERLLPVSPPHPDSTADPEHRPTTKDLSAESS